MGLKADMVNSEGQEVTVKEQRKTLTSKKEQEN